MHPLGDAVALRVVRGDVLQGDVVDFTVTLELSAGELSAVVQNDAS